jgi:hypothetical protein
MEKFSNLINKSKIHKSETEHKTLTNDQVT